MKLLLATIFLISTLATAHSGRTDSSGGHNNRSTGGYHYHNSGYSKPSYSSECHYVDDDYGNYAYVTESGSSCSPGPSKSKKSSSPSFFGSLIDKYFDDSDEPVKGFSMNIPGCIGKSWQRAACNQAIKKGRYIKGCEKDPICRRRYPNNLRGR
jgi:hypothetical protein